MVDVQKKPPDRAPAKPAERVVPRRAPDDFDADTAADEDTEDDDEPEDDGRTLDPAAKAPVPPPPPVTPDDAAHQRTADRARMQAEADARTAKAKPPVHAPGPTITPGASAPPRGGHSR